MILVNTTIHTLDNTRFKMTGCVVRKLYEIERNGQLLEKEFLIDEEGFMLIREEFSSLSTKTFIIET